VVRIVSPFFPTVVVSSRRSVRMRLRCDHVYLSATPMLIASAKPGESGLVTTSLGISAEKKCTYNNQARSFGLS
jgi:hypothetical protein